MYAAPCKRYDRVTVRLYPAKVTRRPARCPMAPPINRPIPANPQMEPMPPGPRWKTCSPKSANRICAAPPPRLQPTEIIAMPIISGTLPMYARPAPYSCHARVAVAVAARRTRKPPGTEICQMAHAENANDSELSTNAPRYPSRAVLYPACSVPAVSVAHCVVWVSELAACNSSGVAMVGRMGGRPAGENGDANNHAATEE